MVVFNSVFPRPRRARRATAPALGVTVAAVVLIVSVAVMAALVSGVVVVVVVVVVMARRAVVMSVTSSLVVSTAVSLAIRLSGLVGCQLSFKVFETHDVGSR
jgi:hypothetical protein